MICNCVNAWRKVGANLAKMQLRKSFRNGHKITEDLQYNFGCDVTYVCTYVRTKMVDSTVLVPWFGNKSRTFAVQRFRLKV